MISIEINDGEVALAGEFNILSVPELFEHYPDFDESVRAIDLSKLEKVDSSGLALLVYWHAKLVEKPGFSGFRNCPERLLNLAKLVGLDTIFET